MNHPRTILRHAIADRLAGMRDDGTPWTAAGTRVLLTRSYVPASTADLPALVVYGGGEDVAEASYPIDGENGQTRRTCTLIVDCVAGAGATAEDDLDDLAAGVEAAIEWLAVPEFESATIRLLRSDAPVDQPGAVATLVGRLSVQVRYYAPYRTRPADAPFVPRLFVSPLPWIGTAHEADYEELLP